MESIEITPEAVNFVTYSTTFDCTNTKRALQGSGIAPPKLKHYIPALWQYWESNLSPMNNP